MAVSVGAMAALSGLPAVPYDPTTGQYVGPDGRIYTQSDLAGMAPGAKTWQQLVVPPLAAH
jgi:phospholipid/cholesterol/gamma-HCH transport system substrate-binding protein